MNVNTLARTAFIIFSVLVPLSAQAPIAPRPQWQPARTEWGDPDLEGIWLTANTLGLPMQRPADDRDESLLRELVDGGAVEATLLNEGVPPLPREQDRRLALDEWRRTHFAWGTLVVDPQDGRLPALTASAKERARTAWRSSSQTTGPWTRAADLGPVERCISRGVLGSMLPSFDYHGTEIVQAPGVVVIRSEAIHEARVVPLDARPPLSSDMRGYTGDARGYWDDDTLVIESTNFNGRTGAHFGGNEAPTGERLRLVERFTRVAERSIEYQITVDDPDTWVSPWTVAFPLARNPEYEWSEYACHEGNYALPNILSAARALERQAR
ncbi:MAG TPA: hypothetical protein VH436_31555 [Vicinamibacterales bacterium]|jgi:hypothetical protein